MFKRFLPCIGGVFRSDRHRNVSCEADALLPGFVNYGEILFAWKEGVDLNEICTLLFLLNHSLTRLGLGAYADGTWPEGFRAVDDGAGDQHVGSEQLTGFALPPPFLLHRPTPHDPHPSHAVGEEKREIFGVTPMHMHIPKPGNQELARGVDYSGIPRKMDVRRFAEFNDTVAGYDDGHVWFRGGSSRVDDGDVRQGERRGGGLGLRSREKRQEAEKQGAELHTRPQELG